MQPIIILHELILLQQQNMYKSTPVWLVQDINYNLISHTGCCYDRMIKDTCIIINYHVQYLILDAQRRFQNLKRFN